jgi:3-phenylpropionate/trans-cinnamate dioxygenase ferredoxin subunit
VPEVDVAAAGEIEDGATKLVEVDGTPILLVNAGGALHAIHDICTHAEESLEGGFVENGTIECPRHGALFSLENGDPLTPPATQALPTFPVEVRDGRVLVDPTQSAPHPLWD